MREVARIKVALLYFINNSYLFGRLSDLFFGFRNKNWKNEPYFIAQPDHLSKKSEFAAVLHLYYTDNWESIFKAKLRRLLNKLNYDLYITMPSANISFTNSIKNDFPDARIFIVPNKGRDVLPFIKVASKLKEMGYSKVLKIHSKKSTHRETSNTASAGSGDEWLCNTLNALIPEDDVLLDDVVNKISSKNTGMIGPLNYYYPLKMYLRYNRKNVERLVRNSVDHSFFTAAVSRQLHSTGYFGGTMFWVDLDSINEALSISKRNFPKENGQFDRTTAHALERIFCILPQLKGKSIYGVANGEITLIDKDSGRFPDWYYDDVSGGKPQISIIVPVYADWSSLSKNISSLRRELGNSEDFSVHYVNDCGPEADDLEDKILNAIAGLTNFYYYRNKKNLGFVKTCNKAVLELVNQNDDILLLNSDTKVTHGFATEMRRTLYSEDDIGAVTARSNNATIWSVPMTAKFAYHRVLSYTLYRVIKHKLPYKYITPTIHGFCVLIRREVINEFGMFDEAYGRGYGEENDFAMRIQKGGWKCAVANWAFVFHYESRSFGNDERNKQIQKNEQILLERYPNYRKLVQEYWDAIEEPLK